MDENNQAQAPQQPPIIIQQVVEKPKKPIYKKWWFWLLVVIVLIIAIAASSGDDEGGEPATDAAGQTIATTAAPKDQTYGLNQPAKLRDLTITALEVSSGTGSNQFLQPSEGNTYIGVKFEIANTSDQEQSISSMLLFDAYVDDVLTSLSFSAITAFESGSQTLDGSILPGKKIIGWYGLEAPTDFNTVEVRVKNSWLSSNDVMFSFSK